MKIRQIDKIIIHCAYTRPSQDIGVAEIRDWHVKGNGWSDVGYHHVIRRNGEIEKGRQEATQGAHAVGHNATSIGVCLVGGRREDKDEPDCNFTKAQWWSLMHLVQELTKRHPDAEVIGHRDVSAKPCPCFDVRAWWGS